MHMDVFTRLSTGIVSPVFAKATNVDPVRYTYEYGYSLVDYWYNSHNPRLVCGPRCATNRGTRS